MFRKLTIKYKIILLTIAITIPAIFFSSFFVLLVNLNSLKKDNVETTKMDAKIINELIALPMTFGYKEQVYDLLKRLSTKESIVSLQVLDNGNQIFTQYNKKKSKRTNKLKSFSEKQYYFNSDTLFLKYPISYENQFFGHLIITSKTGISEYFKRSMKYIILIGILVSLISFFLIHSLQKFITKPIVKLAEITAHISKIQDYSVKVNTKSEDEIGVLYEQFRRLLQSIQNKEAENIEIVRRLEDNQLALLRTQAIAGIGSWERDLKNNKVHWSPEEYKIFGVKQNDDLDFTKIKANIHEDDKEAFTKQWNDAINHIREYNIEFRYYTKNGLKWLLEKAEFQYDTNGEVIRALGFTLDITKRKEQEIELNEHRNNLEEKVNLRTNQIIQMSSDISTKNEELNKINHELNTEKRKVEEQSYKIQIVNNTLIRKTKELESALEKLKSAQSQLVQQEKMASLGTLTAGIAHEINNPINFISSNMMGLETLLEDLITNNQSLNKKLQKTENNIELFENIKEIHQNINLLLSNIKIGIDRTVEIIKSLRTFSRESEENFILADLNANLDSTLLLLKNQYKDKINITKNYGNIPNIYCSIGKINQVFMNIIANAIQAIESIGEIIISTSHNEKYVIIEIKDNGCGIKPEIQSKIFEPFYTTKEIGKGTGLGLAISYNIIKNHKGQIKVNSTPEKGTSFLVYLPIK